MTHLRHVLMIQGASANAGKSIIAGALCRYLADRGVRVAPFKPILVCQSVIEERGICTDTRFLFLTRAARLELSADYNPIQIIPAARDCFGRIVSTAVVRMPGRQEFHVPLYGVDAPLFQACPEDVRQEVKSIIERHLNYLRERFDVVVVEGAGNPSDLGEEDVTNHFVVSRFRPKTVLVAKVSAGGAAAGLVGTYELLPAAIKQSVVGYILNDIMNGRSIVEESARTVTARLGIPCLGMFPNLWSVRQWSSSEEELEMLSHQVAEHLDVSLLLPETLEFMR